jgi:transcriptional regulator with XRE-family HTH domain
MTDLAATDVRVGPLLRTWRQRRRLSQLDLALEAGVSARHVSFVETGRSRPSPEMVLHLAEQLEVPLRERNELLLAAGYAPAYRQRALDDPELAPVRKALQVVLDGHGAWPAAVVDRSWNMVAANAGLGLLVEGVAPELMQPPVNLLRVGLHPDGAASRIVNLAEWRAHLLDRLRRQVERIGAPQLQALYDELSDYPGGGESDVGPSNDIFVPLRIRTRLGELSFFSTVATFGAAVDITVAELGIESFFPADAATGEAMRAYAREAAESA